MKHVVAPVKNIVAAQSAFQTLSERDIGVPGMMLIHGDPGMGKTTALAWLINQVNGVFVRANATWTANSMLASVMAELGVDPMHSTARMLNHIVSKLAESGRPLFVDEANYLVHSRQMLETLRDIHDIANVPVVLCGAESIERKLPKYPQLQSRISQWVEFKSADIDDARTLIDAVSEIALSPDLLQHLWQQAKGSMRLMTVGLSRIESFARSNGLSEIDAEQWGGRQLFMGGRV